MAKPILISISPNISLDDVILAIKIILKPWLWHRGSAINSLTKKLQKLTKQKHSWLFNLGRNALQVGLEALELNSKDEVLCQAFTCVAVPNAIKWAGAKPVFIDTIKNGFNLDLNDLVKKITKNSKALIIQHTFGLPDQIKEIQKICKKYNLILIEDCAHSLGVNYQNKPVGSFADLTMLSFGRDKIISSVFGGALLTRNQKLAKKINYYYLKLDYPSNFWTLKQLLHPIITYLVKPIYFSIGKYFIFIYQKSGLLSFPVLSSEKQSKKSFPTKKLPNALAILALNQLNKLNKLNQQRITISKTYQKIFKVQTLKYLPLLRFPILVHHPDRLIKKAKKHHLLLGDWYRPVIAPKGVEFESIGYKQGSCPNANIVSRQVVNLPTLISKKQAQQVIKVINDHR